MPEPAPVRIRLKVNGKEHAAEVEPRMLLVDLLREQLELTGTHVGCDTSFCGACTVLLNGAPVKSCTLFAFQADQREIMTVEGLEQEGKLHPIQQAFAEHHGLQCGYCTPGMLLSAYHLLATTAKPSEKQVRRALAGNCCRCTGYQNIFKAVEAAAARISAADLRG